MENFGLFDEDDNASSAKKKPSNKIDSAHKSLQDSARGTPLKKG